VNWPDYVNQMHKHGEDNQIGESINSLVDAISARIRSAATIWCFGNGGSATTAEHFAADLLLMGSRTGTECSALSLTSQIGSMTALANDIDYSEVISRQLRAVVKPNDLVIGFSASGNSENVISALKYCKEVNVESYCFLGFNGGSLLQSGLTRSIHFSTEQKLYGLVENLHLAACHFVIDKLVETNWSKEAEQK
jgi:D-sedoheptulose 7-phosphate isomerase